MTKTAVFAGGCFWCMEPPYADMEGVVNVQPGYTGGHTESPTYEQVCGGDTGHFEAVEITYDPDIVSFEQLLEVFWRQIDPTDAYGQFADRGGQYRTAIFYDNEDEKRAAEDAVRRVQRLFDKRVRTLVLPKAEFYPAESGHCAYYRKNPAHYGRYKTGSGRAAYIADVWGGETLRQRLTPMQDSVTRENATEPPFRNEYWDNSDPGLYVDVISGEPLFTSLDKFDSGCGWPSFSKPVDPRRVRAKTDLSHGMVRTEIRAKGTDAHLGHVFDDGPLPGGQRYCINSAALRFVPLADFDKEGYSAYKKRFE